MLPASGQYPSASVKLQLFFKLSPNQTNNHVYFIKYMNLILESLSFNANWTESPLSYEMDE